MFGALRLPAFAKTLAGVDGMVPQRKDQLSMRSPQQCNVLATKRFQIMRYDTMNTSLVGGDNLFRTMRGHYRGTLVENVVASNRQ